jgi:beta-glucanase (GH16 family)
MCFFKPKPIFNPIAAGYKPVMVENFLNPIDWEKWDWREPWSGSSDTWKGYTIWKQECVVQKPDGIHLIARRGTETRNHCGMLCSHKFWMMKPGDYIVVNAKIAPKGLLYFSAPGWLYGDHFEIDIAEAMGKNSKSVTMTHHWEKPGGNRAFNSKQFVSSDFSEDFHNYAIRWEPSKLTWYIDGIERFTSVNNIPDEEMYFVSNIQAGGEIAFTHLFEPDEIGEMIIRSIEVWQL